MPPKKRVKTAQDWSWAGVEVEMADQITPTHRRRAAGLVDLRPCTILYPSPSHNGQSSTTIKKDIGCSEKLCKGNARCYNHLGAEEVLGEGAKKRFVQRKAGNAPERRKGPAGLRNMGATCYANAFLQLWFHNTTFRTSLYACNIPERTKLYHLVKVFAFLQESQRPVVDPRGLVEALKLNTGGQQDAGEFANLFMNRINSELSYQAAPESKHIMKRLFQGKKENRTQCHGCGAVTSVEDVFLDLELSLKDGESLDDRLAASLAEEVLHGDNQYRCGSCGDKCDATRSTRIQEWPDILNLTLLRFTYDWKKQERKKSKASIRYPKTARFGMAEYDLQAVLLHLGSSPYSGHFVCRVLTDGEWYECNDEAVERIVPTVNSKLKGDKDGTESSKDAYILVYKRRSAAPITPSSLPPAIAADVEADNAAFQSEIADWELKRNAAESDFDTLMVIKEPVLMALSGTDVIVPRDELKKWIEADMEDLGAIDYTDLRCEHTGHIVYLDPGKMQNARLISRAAANAIRARSILLDAEICPTCIEDGFYKRISLHSRQEDAANFDALNGLDGQYLIPKDWLRDWKADKLAPGCKPTDNGYSLYCLHENPWPRGRASTPITSEALEVLRSSVGDFCVFTDDALPCAACSAAEEMSKGSRTAWEVELKRDKAFKKHKSNVITMLDTDYFVFSLAFSPIWHHWLLAPGPRPQYISDICEHGRLPYDPADEHLSYLTAAGWAALQGVYGQQEAVTVQEKGGVIRSTSHEVCQPCRLLRLLDWVNTEVCIVVVDADNIVIDKPTSRRSSRKTHQIPVTKDTTLKQLRLDIFKLTRINPMSQLIRYDGRLLLDADQTMEQIGLRANGIMQLSEAEEKDEVDVPAVEGFAGTALLGGRPCLDCTYENDAGTEYCAMCSRPLLMGE